MSRNDSLAARTRERARESPFLVEALAAGVLNYTAAARFLELEGADEEAVATALRRFEDDLARETDDRALRVRMESGVGLVEDEAGLLSVGEVAIQPDEGQQTALVARGDVDAATLATVLGRLSVAGIDPTTAGVGGDALVVVVDRRAGADALRILEGIESVATVSD